MGLLGFGDVGGEAGVAGICLEKEDEHMSRINILKVALWTELNTLNTILLLNTQQKTTVYSVNWNALHTSFNFIWSKYLLVSQMK